MNTLEVICENGSNVKIRVYDILDENLFNKKYIIYTLDGDDNTLFASILNESEDSFSLDSITTIDELSYINKEIDLMMNETEAV